MSNLNTVSTRLQPQWRWSGFFLLQLAAALLLASWVWPVTRELWVQLDMACFSLLNGSLAESSAWSGLWAIASLRPFDLMAAGLMLLLLIEKNGVFGPGLRLRALLTFVALLMVLLVVRYLFSELVAAYAWQHHSPSIAVPGSIRLSEQYPWLSEHLHLKDASKRSFPGDHAAVMMIWGSLLALFARRGKLALILGLAVFFMLPRLFAGAHWLSDDLVGGSILALLTFAWGYCTPLAGLLARLFERLATPLLNLLPPAIRAL